MDTSGDEVTSPRYPLQASAMPEYFEDSPRPPPEPTTPSSATPHLDKFCLAETGHTAQGVILYRPTTLDDTIEEEGVPYISPEWITPLFPGEELPQGQLDQEMVQHLCNGDSLELFRGASVWLSLTAARLSAAGAIQPSTWGIR